MIEEETIDFSSKKMLDKITPYAVSSVVFEKILDKADNPIMFHKSEFDQKILDWDRFLEKTRDDHKGILPKEVEKADKEITELKNSLELVIIKNEKYSHKDLGKLYGVYVKGINKNSIQTMGGYKFSEVAAKHVGIYNPLRQKLGHRY